MNLYWLELATHDATCEATAAADRLAAVWQTVQDEPAYLRRTYDASGAVGAADGELRAALARVDAARRDAARWMPRLVGEA